MINRAEMAAATRRLRASSSELSDVDAAAEASARMTYLWTWSVRQGGVLDREDLEIAIWSFFIEYPNGLLPKDGGSRKATPNAARSRGKARRTDGT